MTGTAPLLAVDDLSVAFPTEDGVASAVSGMSFTLDAGETLGIVGESGSGKSVTTMAVLGLLPGRARITGSIRLRGRELLGLPDDELRSIRGQEISMVFQDALAALNPVQTIGEQLMEAVRVHDGALSRAHLRERAIEVLDVVGIPSPRERAAQYPHEFSGGMRQRVMIAMAIVNEPAVLIADEPTTALDVTVQAQILDVLERIQERTRTAIMLITHDLGVIAGLADRVIVVYAGRAVEQSGVDDLYHDTAHPYTSGLLASLPRLDRARERGLTPIAGQPPNQLQMPQGCRFHPRCPYAVAGRCDTVEPVALPVTPGHTSACVRVDELRAAGALGRTA
jgi:oligopeptide/dipeptide ABC transporter ATP-binding protein